MPRLLILGATGGTGQHVLKGALARGYDVTVLVRRPERLPAGVERARVLTGDVLDSAELDSAMQGQDVVISALGRGQSLRSRGLIARSVPMILQAMERAGVRRLVFTSAYGAGGTSRDVPLIPRIMIEVLLRGLYADKEAGEAILRRSTLDWTLVHPSTLTNGPRVGRCRVGQRLKMRGLPTIARADLADFLLGQIDDATYIRKGVLITS